MKYALAIALLAALPAAASMQTKSGTFSGIKLYYRVIVPNDYDAAKEYPMVIAFPGGAQTMPMVDGVIARNWKLEAEKRGYIVAVLSAPGAGRFYEGGGRVFPEFLEQLLKDYKVRGGKFHIAGISNGGLSSFHIAASHPQYFLSVTGFPGYLPDVTAERVAALAKICLNMHVGEMDPAWLLNMQAQAEVFRKQGAKVRFTIEKGEGHVMRTFEFAYAARLFDQFDEASAGCGK
jgi:poly(3-hydroxybutyrate) depolymerase